MGKLAEIEQSLGAREDIFKRRVAYFTGNLNEFHSVHFYVAPKTGILSDLDSFRDFMDGLPQRVDSSGGFYRLNGKMLKLGSLEYHEYLPGDLIESTTMHAAISDPALAREASGANATYIRVGLRRHPLSRRIHVRPYPTPSMALLVSSYEARIIRGTAKEDARLTNLRRHINLDDWEKVINGENPFPKIVRARKGYYANTPQTRAMLLDALSDIKDFSEMANRFFGDKPPEEIERAAV